MQTRKSLNLNLRLNHRPNHPNRSRAWAKHVGRKLITLALHRFARFLELQAGNKCGSLYLQKTICIAVGWRQV